MIIPYDNTHDWEKQNLVTLKDRKRGQPYDIFKCKDCGIEGKSINIVSLRVKGSYSLEKVLHCTGNKKEISAVPTLIRIKNMGTPGEIFANLKPGSEHPVIAPPAGYVNNADGVWVMGVGEAVRVMAREFEDISPK